MMFRNHNRPQPAKKKCRKHPNINAVAGKDLCKNCLSADALGRQMAQVNAGKPK